MNEITEYSQTEAALAELRDRLAGVVYDVATTSGMESARKDRRELVTLRTSLESMRKEIKAPALARCQAIDAEAKRITTAILEIEEPIDRQIKAEEARKAEEKRLREEAEQKRVQAIHAKIAAITALPLQTVNMTAAQVEDLMAKASESLAITEEDFAEFVGLALTEKSQALETLAGIREKKAFAEAEAEAARLETERIAAEQAEQQARLDAQRKQAEAEAAALRAELEREKEALRLKREEEEKRLAALRAEEEAKIAAERAEIEKQRQAEEDERKAKEAEQAALEAKRQAEARAAEEKAAREEQARRDAEFAVRLATPYEALTAILEIAEDTTVTAAAARQRIIQAARMALDSKPAQQAA